MGSLFSHQGNAQPVGTAEAAPVQATFTRFTRPALDTDEGGLWAMMDREEVRLRRSPFVARDAALSRYIQDIVCRLAGEHCPDVRVHVVRTPLFNANMAPNGMMQVWSGLLLRIENEAQLAAILGHELAHYLERHTVERLRDLKSRSAFAQFLGMFGLIGAIGQLGALAGAFAFSREQETRADRLGIHLMKQAGYDGRQASQVWDNLLQELRANGDPAVGKNSPMMATHPPEEARRDQLLALAGNGEGRVGAAEYEQVIAPHRTGWLQDEIKRNRFDESLVLLDRLLGKHPEDATLLFARGEVYRQRAGKDDAELAVQDFSRAVAQQKPPAEAYRSLGLIHKRDANTAQAVDAFEKYLAAAPDAADGPLIKNYVQELRP